MSGWVWFGYDYGLWSKDPSRDCLMAPNHWSIYRMSKWVTRSYYTAVKILQCRVFPVTGESKGEDDLMSGWRPYTSGSTCTRIQRPKAAKTHVQQKNAFLDGWSTLLVGGLDGWMDWVFPGRVRCSLYYIEHLTVVILIRENEFSLYLIRSQLTWKYSSKWK